MSQTPQPPIPSPHQSQDGGRGSLPRSSRGHDRASSRGRQRNATHGSPPLPTLPPIPAQPQQPQHSQATPAPSHGQGNSQSISLPHPATPATPAGRRTDAVSPSGGGASFRKSKRPASIDSPSGAQGSTSPRGNYWSTVLNVDQPTSRGPTATHSQQSSSPPRRTHAAIPKTPVQLSGGASASGASSVLPPPSTKSKEKTQLPGDIRSGHGSPSKRFECSQCGRRFERRGHLQEHIDSVHNLLKRFSCPVCESQFAHGSSVRRHMMKSHKQAPQQ